MIRSIVDQVLQECAVPSIVAPALAVLLTQAGCIGSLIPTIIVIIVRVVVRIGVKGAVEPEAREECEGRYG